MKFHLLAISLLTSCISLVAQEYEEKIADLSCEYIQNIDITSDIQRSMKKCILQAKFEVERKYPELKPNVSIEELREKYTTVFTLITKNCKTLITKTSENKKHLFYQNSANEEAQYNYEKGNKLVVEDNHKSAISAYKRALSLDPNYILALDKLGITYMQINDFKKANKYFKKSLDIFPEGDIALQNLGESYFKLEDMKDASVTFSTLSSFYPENAKSYLWLAKTELKDELNEAALYHSIVSLSYFSSTEEKQISDANNMIKSIYTIMEENDQLTAFDAIAKENDFNYDSIK